MPLLAPSQNRMSLNNQEPPWPAPPLVLRHSTNRLRRCQRARLLVLIFTFTFTFKHSRANTDRVDGRQEKTSPVQSYVARKLPDCSLCRIRIRRGQKALAASVQTKKNSPNHHDYHSTTTYAVVVRHKSCTHQPAALSIRYLLLLQENNTHSACIFLLWPSLGKFPSLRCDLEVVDRPRQ